MKKTTRKLAVSRETLRNLEAQQLGLVAGGTGTSLCRVFGPPTTTHPTSLILSGCKMLTDGCNFNTLACGGGSGDGP